MIIRLRFTDGSSEAVPSRGRRLAGIDLSDDHRASGSNQLGPPQAVRPEWVSVNAPVRYAPDGGALYDYVIITLEWDGSVGLRHVPTGSERSRRDEHGVPWERLVAPGPGHPWRS